MDGDSKFSDPVEANHDAGQQLGSGAYGEPIARTFELTPAEWVCCWRATLSKRYIRVSTDRRTRRMSRDVMVTPNPKLIARFASGKIPRYLGE